MSEHGDGSPEPEEPARAEAPASAVPMQILGRLEEFDPMTDMVAAYEEREPKSSSQLMAFLKKSLSERVRQVTVSATQELIYAHSTSEKDSGGDHVNFERTLRAQAACDCRVIQLSPPTARKGRNHCPELRKLTVNCDFGRSPQRSLCLQAQERNRAKEAADYDHSHLCRSSQDSPQAAEKACQLQSHGSATRQPAVDVGNIQQVSAEGGAYSCYRCGKSGHTKLSAGSERLSAMGVGYRTCLPE